MTLPLARRLRIFLPFALGYFLSYLYRTINAVLAPNLVADIGIDPSDLGLLTGAYFITFAAFQLPLGVLLDRYGPRRIEALLLTVAAAGALVFARSHSLAGLVIGRGLIGFGVSACLMAAFKAFVLWFPKGQLPRVNGFQMAAGGLGALFATTPVEAALSVTDWRGVFTVLGVLTLGVAGAIFFVVPEKENGSRDLRFSDQVRGIGAIFTSLAFWRIAPWTTLSQTTLLAIHGLWAGPWLRDVAGFDRAGVAATLMLVSGAMVVSFVFLGMAAERLSRRGIPPMSVAAAGMGCFAGVLLVIILLEPVEWAVPVWILFGFFGASGILPYAVLSQSFPAHLAGRANTALNLLVFVAAFSVQWGMGAIIDRYSPTPAGGYAPAGYQAAFSTLLILQMVTIVWYGAAGMVMRRRGDGDER
ncbi:MAG: MFS transporter [Desulfococcaceae bacterium]